MSNIEGKNQTEFVETIVDVSFFAEVEDFVNRERKLMREKIEAFLEEKTPQVVKEHQKLFYDGYVTTNDWILKTFGPQARIRYHADSDRSSYVIFGQIVLVNDEEKIYTSNVEFSLNRKEYKCRIYVKSNVDFSTGKMTDCYVTSDSYSFILTDSARKILKENLKDTYEEARAVFQPIYESYLIHRFLQKNHTTFELGDPWIRSKYCNEFLPLNSKHSGFHL